MTDITGKKTKTKRNHAALFLPIQEKIRHKPHKIRPNIQSKDRVVYGAELSVYCLIVFRIRGNMQHKQKTNSREERES